MRIAFGSDGAQGKGKKKKQQQTKNKTTPAIPALKRKVNREAVQMKCCGKRKACKIKVEIQ